MGKSHGGVAVTGLLDAVALLVAVPYSLAAAAIGLYSIAQAHLLWGYFRRTDPAIPTSVETDTRVTVQLPIYNERTVVEALLDSVAAMRWPPNQLEIQLLDDSTDETVELAARKVTELRAAGVNIRHIRRADRSGYKAGALAHGLEQASGDLIAIFDADFRPRPNYLEQAVALLHAHPDWGLVQARWAHINRSASAITEAQAFHLDAHFTIEQAARSRAPLLMGFNGTAGVWRRQAIADAGGWSADTLTEDLDLAFRCQLAGWQLGYVDALDAPAELPDLLPAVRSQQHRWMKGGAQVSRKLLGTLWRSRRPLVTRLQGTVHLTGGSIFLCVLALCILSPAVGPLMQRVPWFRYALSPAGLVLQIALGILLVFYGTMCVHRESGVPAGLQRLLRTFPSFMALSAGLSLHNTVAVVEGWSGHQTPFVRTPKQGDAVTALQYRAARAGPLVYLELAIALWGVAGLIWAVAANQWVLAVFLGSQAAGFLMVSWKSVES
jgi:cellulose synthase/poly-beta-1,6-N-acetylglucosamine synthase-like glycosyltransferase